MTRFLTALAVVALSLSAARADLPEGDYSSSSSWTLALLTICCWTFGGT